MRRGGAKMTCCYLKRFHWSKKSFLILSRGTRCDTALYKKPVHLKHIAASCGLGKYRGLRGWWFTLFLPCYWGVHLWRYPSNREVSKWKLHRPGDLQLDPEDRVKQPVVANSHMCCLCEPTKIGSVLDRVDAPRPPLSKTSHPAI